MNKAERNMEPTPTAEDDETTLEPNYLVRKNLNSLALVGMWPFQTEKFLKNKKLRRCHEIYGLIVFAAFVIFQLSEYMELFAVWGDLENMMVNISISFLYTYNVMKWTAIFLKRQKFKDLIAGISLIEKNIVKYQNEDVNRIMRAYTARSDEATYFFWSVVAVTCFGVWTSPFLEYRYSPVFHRIENGTEYWSYVKPMIFSSWFPFDKYSKISYRIACAYQSLMLFIGSSFIAIWDMFIVCMIIHSIGQLQILQYKMENMTNVDLGEYSELVASNKRKLQPLSDAALLEEIKNRRLVDCISHHRYIMSYCRDLNAIISPIMLVYFIICSIMFCAIGFQAVLYGFSVRVAFMMEYLVAVLIELFLFYWHGNEVIVEQDKLLLSTYSCDWYNQSRRFKQSLWIMREGVRMPIKYTVGIFYTMSLATFIMILKTSYSYFALLRKMEDKIQ